MTNDKSQMTKKADTEQKTLYVKLDNEDGPEYERLKLVHMMFPGNERLIIHFTDTKKNVGTKCIIHEAFLDELNTMLGAGNVVIR
jgi:DNA polymerase-3 subunit alpha